MAEKGIISIENAKICFRNFAGKESKFNSAGRRNFCVLIDHKTAEELKADGWNVKYLRPREDGDDPQPYLQVSVAFGDYPPKVVLIAGGKKTELNEETVSSLDYAEIENVDLIIRPYTWEVNGKGGIKAYLKTMYVTIVEDEFEKKYRNLESEDDSLPF